MKDDILWRLRDLRPGYGNIIQDAIEEIERLRADHQVLLAFVKSTAELSPIGFERGDEPSYIIEEAKEVLKGLAFSNEDS